MIRRLVLELRNLNVLYFVPILIIWVFMPLIGLSFYVGYGAESGYYQALEESQRFVSYSSMLWSVFVMKEFVNAPGKELLFVYQQKKDNILLRSVILWVWYLAHVVLLFVFFSFLFDSSMFWPYILIAAQCLFMSALTYFLTILCRNTFLPLIAALLYCLIFTLITLDSIISVFLLDSDYSAAEVYPKVIYAFLVSAALYVIGYLSESRRLKSGI